MCQPIEPTFTLSGGAAIHYLTSRIIRYLTLCKGKVTMSVPTWPGASGIMGGGVKGKSSSTWMVTRIGLQSVAQEPKTTLAEPGILNFPKGNMAFSPHRTLV